MNLGDEWYSGLVQAADSEVRDLERYMKVSAISGADYPDWEKRLRDPSASPITHMRVQRQLMNDCQGQSLCNGEEKRHWYCTGTMVQFADMYAYNGSEYAGRPQNVGRDQGTSIQSGVKLITQGLRPIDVKPGLPEEKFWPYSKYERSSRVFAERAKNAPIDETWVSQHGEMPDWEGALVAMAAGGSIHIGTYWAPRWKPIGNFRLMDDAPRGGGGHATEIVWAMEVQGTWYLVVWNSHGDRFYLMSRKCYEQLQRNQCRPFGGYLLMPDQPEERYIDWYEDSPWRI